MKIRLKFILCISIFLLLIPYSILAADDELEDLSDDSKTEELADSDSDLDIEADKTTGSDEESDSDESNVSVSFGGYAKGLVYWNQETYSDDLWSQFQVMSASGMPAPAKQDLSGYNALGSRLQLKVEGFLSDRARLFSAVNIDFNSATPIHSRSEVSNAGSQMGEVRMVETYVEIYEGSRIWKIGSQILTWGYLEGFEVPTDRVNARDYSYKSTEYEDSKLPSTGVLLTQSVGSSQLELMVIPVAQVNTDMPFRDYFFAGAEESPEHIPSNGKYAARFSSSAGNLDYALSYVEGIDPQPDIQDVTTQITFVNPATNALTVTTADLTGKTYHRIKSPGVDLQYNFGSWLAKASAVGTITEDASGDSPFIKNNWSKVVVGAEFSIFENTVNLYAGQTTVENFPEDPILQQKSFLVGQIREQTNFISGHIYADFLAGNALNMVFMGAVYQDQDGETMQTNVRATFKYKIADGLEILISPAYMNLMENIFNDFQAEVKYAF
jgi:hypothetical protein